MKVSEVFPDRISLLGYGLMRLPRLAGMASGIDYETASKLIDHAIANGVNIFDTAYTYHGCEEFSGYALSAYPRDSYYLSTKCPPWMVEDAGDFERIFSEQCRRCRTDYFDFYLMHNLAKENKRAAGNEEHFERFINSDFYDMLKQKKSEGRIRRLGFSYHGTIEILRKLVDRFEWDFALIQLNYVDWAATGAKGQYELLAERGIPVMIMEPLRGGTLANLSSDAAALLKNARADASIASWGVRYAASLPNVVTVLSGMSEIAHLDDNLATMANFVPVDDSERSLLYEAAAVNSKSGAIACTGCGYCLPCPNGVDIPRIFSIYNYYRHVNFRIPFDNGYSTLSQSENASGCTDCGQCVDRCPQDLAIPGHLTEIDAFAKQG